MKRTKIEERAHFIINDMQENDNIFLTHRQKRMFIRFYKTLFDEEPNMQRIIDVISSGAIPYQKIGELIEPIKAIPDDEKTMMKLRYGDR